ncbi:hypothetical protein [uncultured Aquimarina sp.]|uniref:hypothetical protein n=1 Tax=uncultured Aquimarina sp. TaxID=575652 RepID=UPI00260B9FED|nr:hypothetical protein [uncultured Aquimarina sp.]
MKKIIVIGLLLISVMTYSQINVGRSRSPINLYVVGHKKEVFEKVKNTKTVFVLPESLDVEKLQTLIKDIWTVNEIIFIDRETFENQQEDYINADFSIIRHVDSGYSKQKTGGFMGPGTRTVGAFIVFKFMMISDFKKIRKDKKGRLKYDATNIAEIFFTPNIRLRQDFNYSEGGKMKIGSFDKINEKYGEEPGFYNFDLGYIKNYFQELNRKLNNEEVLKIEDGIVNKEKLKELKDQVLYAPEWVLKKYNALAATWGKTRTADKLFAKYNYKYEIISNESLNDKILAGEDFYYLMHTQFNQKKIISVINSVSGEIIYLEEGGSYNLKDSDLKSIAKLIK